MSNTLQTKENIVPIETLLQSMPSSSLDRIQNQIVKNAAALRAINDPLPGPLADAVYNEPIEVETSQGTVKVRKVVAYDVVVFKKLNSPFYRQLLEQNKKPEEREDITFTEEEQYEMIYQFIAPILDVKKTLDKSHDNYKNVATESVGLIYDLSDMALLIQAIEVQILRSFKTLTAHGVIEPEDKVEAAMDKMAKSEADKAAIEQSKKN